MSTREWEVKETGSNSLGVYFQLNLRTKGQMVAPISVKHCTRFGTFVCLTCVTADRCEHALFVRKYVEASTAAPSETLETQQETEATHV